MGTTIFPFFKINEGIRGLAISVGVMRGKWLKLPILHFNCPISIVKIKTG